MLYKQEIKTILDNSIDEMTNALESHECKYNYKKPYENKFYNLYAVSGDLSAYGMSDKATVLTINREHMANVELYIEMQKIWSETLSILSDDISKAHNKYPGTFDILYQLWRKSNALMADIFDNKYCYRTEWAFLSK
jgi:hypothetical protein